VPPHAELQRAYRRLICGLAVFEVTHALALVGTGLWLVPGLNPEHSVAERAAYIASHATWWRLGWLLWQLSAASDVWVAVAMVGWTRAVGDERAQRWAWFGAGFLLVAIVPEQYAEASLVLSFPSATGALWLERLIQYMWLLGTWTNTGYTLMTGCWLLALRSVAKRAAAAPSAGVATEPSARVAAGPLRAGVWPTWAEALLLSLFLASSFTNHLAWNPQAGIERVGAFQLTSILNGLAFAGLLLFGAALAMHVGELQARATRPGPNAQRPRWPVRRALLGAWLARLAGSPGLRDLARVLQSWLPFPQLRSDVGDVLYLNWLVSADQLEARLDESLRVRRFGDRTMLSILVYRHGHFGPRLLGPLRKLLPSPIQCNVRAYLEVPVSNVAFLTNAIDHSAYFCGARLLCDGLPAHLLESAHLDATGGTIDVALAPGQAVALHLRAQAETTTDSTLPASFSEHFADFQTAIAHIVPQNAALSALYTTGQWCASQIVVKAQLDGARPCHLIAPLELGPPFAEIVEQVEPFVFLLQGVQFDVLGETHALELRDLDPHPRGSTTR